MANSQRLLGLYDVPMWESISEKNWKLQCCANCGKYRYPPAPICDKCLSMEYEWKPISGKGTILSWVRFHRKYFDDNPPPYNNIAVQLDEGPFVVSNLVGAEPDNSFIGKRVSVIYEPHLDYILPKFELDKEDAKAA